MMMSKYHTLEKQTVGDSKFESTSNERTKNNVKTFFISDQNFKKSSIPRKSTPDTRFTRKKETVHICKGQELISSLIKSPIETFDKLMAYLLTPGAIDEEDIIGVENFDECDSKPLAWGEGDNFLAFIKEKHLIQGIEYCNIAINQTIKQHINGIKMRREQGPDNKSKPKVKENFLNSIRAGAIKDIHQEDEQIEVIGYVGCTVGNKVNTTPKVCKQDDPSEHQEDEVKEI